MYILRRCRWSLRHTVVSVGVVVAVVTAVAVGIHVVLAIAVTPAVLADVIDATIKDFTRNHLFSEIKLNLFII